MTHLSIEKVMQGTVTTPEGFAAGAMSSGLKPDDSLDLAIIHTERDAVAAGVFTQNQFAAAPVCLDRDTLAANRSRMRGIIANAGNANACTGEQGVEDAARMQRKTADVLGVDAQQVLVLSTGVIGVPLPMDRLLAGIEALPSCVGPEGGVAAARAIMTTDTKPKHAAIEISLPNSSFRIGGVAKGAGMIHPNMATMLAVLTTDAMVAPHFLQMALEGAVGVSFNAISVDGDTSTNDSVLALANGASGVSIDEPVVQAAFRRGLTDLCVDLAKQIVMDGEGATHFVELHVTGLEDDMAAKQVASTIATSALVKTAIAGGDPNWGRILAAAGRAGVDLDPTRVSLTICTEDSVVELVHEGTPNPHVERDAASVFAHHTFRINLCLGSGSGQATMWMTDLTHEYVRINADYRS